MNRFKLAMWTSLGLLTVLASPRTITAQDLAWHDASGALNVRIQSIASGASGEVYASDDSGYINRAEPNGSDWSKSILATGPTTTVVAALLVHPAGKLFAVSGPKIYASDDNGHQWIQVGTWSRTGRTLGCTFQGTVLVGSTISSVFRSTNLGGSWTAASLPSNANEPAFLAYDSSNVFAATSHGVYRSQSDGATWSLADSSTQSLTVRALTRDVQGRLYAATDSGMYVSADSGRQWTKGTGVPSASSVCDDRGTILCAGSNDALIYRSTDHGISWQSTGATLAVSPRCLAVHSSWKVVAGTASGLFVSNDAGTSWTPLAGGLLGRHIMAIGTSGGRVVIADRDSGVYSTLGEGMWTKSASPFPLLHVQSILGINWQRLFAGTLGNGVYRTTDGGATWVPSNSGLSNLDIYALARRSPAILFAGTAGGVFRSIDSGATWMTAGAGLPAAVVRTFVVSAGTSLFAGTDGAGVFKSTNDGVSWTTANAGLENLHVTTLAISQGDGWLLAGTGSGGVYASPDLGNSWTSANAGLGNLNVLSLVLNSQGDLFAATPTGVFRSTDFAAAWTLQATGFPASPVTGLALASDELLLATTDGSGVVGTTTVTPTPPPAPIVRMMGVGSLHNWFSSSGSEIEVGRSPSADQQDGWQWPAQYPRQDMQDSKGLWIGTTNYVDARGRYFPRKVVHVGPRAKGTGEFIPVAMTSYSRTPKPLVTVGGLNSVPPIADSIDAVSRSLPVDRIITNTANTSIGITMTRRILQSSHPLNDNYIIQEYVFKNTGNLDADPSPERPGITLDSVYFYFLYRFGICADTRYVIGNPTSWGINTMLDTRGDGVMSDPQDQQFRAQIAWHGKFPPFTLYDNIGGPVWVPYFDKTDTVGRLGAAQFNGVLTLHADKSAGDTADDPGQPSTTSWEDMDDTSVPGNSEFNLAQMEREYALITRGHRSPRHAWQVEPMGNFSNPSGNPAMNTPGGFTATNGYGPYTLEPGDSVKIVVAEASAGLSRDKCISVGKLFKRGLISASAKNDSVLTGRDSLFQTFRRAQAAYANGFALGLPPDPPKAFSVSRQAGGIMLAWDVFTEPGPHVTGYSIYRSSPRYDSERSLLVQLPPERRSYLDSSVVRGVVYYYHITAEGDSLESSRFYTQTYDPASLLPLGVDDGNGGVPLTYALDQNYPNPFNPNTIVSYQLPIAGRVSIGVYDLLGREVAVLMDEDKAPGTYRIEFDGAKLASGVYICRMTAGGFVECRKMILMK
jgi:ligand-binding sensor domain-containing protein